MHRLPLCLIAPLVASIALAGLGASPASAAPGWTLSMDVSEDQVTEGEVVRFSGVIDSGTNIHSVDDPVELVASRWPYVTEEVVATGRTADRANYNGAGYTLEHRPQLNTRYYVRSPGFLSPSQPLVSPARNVTMVARVRDFDVRVPRPYVVAMNFKLDFPDLVNHDLGGRTVHWYLVRGKKKAIRIGRSKTKERRGNVVIGRIRTRAPRGRYKFFGAFCINLAVGVDIGVGEVQERRCP